MSSRPDASAPLSLPERLLFLLSRKPGTEDLPGSGEKRSLENAPSHLREASPDFLRLIAGKDVLDFGCGEGCYDWQAIGAHLSEAYRCALGASVCAGEARLEPVAAERHRDGGKGQNVRHLRSL